MTVSRDEASQSAVKQTAANEFASLPLARAYIDTVGEEIGSLALPGLIDALQRLHRAYHEFPELELDRPRRELALGLLSAAKRVPDRAIIPLLTLIIAFDPSSLSSMILLLGKIVESDRLKSLSPILRSLNPSKEFHWNSIKIIVKILQERSREDTISQGISEVLKNLNFTGE